MTLNFKDVLNNCIKACNECRDYCIALKAANKVHKASDKPGLPVIQKFEACIQSCLQVLEAGRHHLKRTDRQECVAVVERCLRAVQSALYACQKYSAVCQIGNPECFNLCDSIQTIMTDCIQACDACIEQCD